MLAKLRAYFSRLSSDKKSLLILVIIIAAIPLAVWMAQVSQEYRQRASESPVTPPTGQGSVSLELSTSEITPDPNTLVLNRGPFNIAVILHAGSYNITGIDFTINFTDGLPITSYTPPQSTSFDSVLTNDLNSSTKQLHFVAAATNPSIINTGDIPLGTITVVPRFLGNADLTFGASQITALDYNDPILANYTNKNYTIVALSPTPLPTTALSRVDYPVPDAGWNLIGLPLFPSEPIDTIRLKQLSGCLEVVRWTNQNWESSIINNFTLETGKGYLIRCHTNGRTGFSIAGTAYNYPMSLSHGWNLVAIPYDRTYTRISEFISQSEFPQAVLNNIKEVDIYEAGGFTSYLVGFPVNNFTLTKDRGYFIKYVDPASNIAIRSLFLPDDITPTAAPTVAPTSVPTNVPTNAPTSAPTPVPGNIDEYPQLDIRDYNIWRDEFLKVVTTTRSDLNRDTKIDLLDFNIWRSALTKLYAPVSPTPSPISSTSKRVFVTSTSYSGNLGGLAGADAKCQESATSAHLGGIWKAWLSDSATGAVSRINNSSTAYVLLNGKTVANNWADLTDGSILNSISVTENNTNFFPVVWTGTNQFGTRYASPDTKSSYSCNDWTSVTSTTYGRYGAVGYTTGGWTDSGSGACSGSASLYCFEQQALDN